ncbi:hypothetical protein HNQ44_001652 [Planomicrobium koreense]|uniref:Uncharacterized protein n=1 Tax=Planococcus koreensis TaxID=112331 RepID=A0A7W8CSU1_9BACL|nr:hypothetical protein [Planococcus koreensis]MBB5180224.1 hypothetical protein [Planococcus koreensis]
MKKWLIALIGIAVVVLSGYAFLSNGFSNIENIKVQTYDSSTDEYGEAKIITDEATLKKVTKFLNRANRETNVHYEMSRREDYKIAVYYENGMSDNFYAWNHPGLNVFLKWPAESGVLRVENKSHRTELLEILND